MIPNHPNVELTKVHYYENCRRHRNAEIETISRHVFENDFNRRLIIRSNIFGHKWVLKINESRDDIRKNSRKCKNNCRIILYVVVFVCIIIAVCFGIFVAFIESNFFQEHNNSAVVTNVPIVKVTNVTIDDKNSILENSDAWKYNRSLEIKNSDHAIERDNVYERENVTHIMATTIEKNTTSVKNRSICNCINEDDICLKVHELGPPECTPAKDKKDPSRCGGLCQIGTQFCKILDRRRCVVQCMNNTNTLKCPERHFNCGNMCIDAVKRCDGFNHCSDHSDEKNCECDLRTHFHCGNKTSCIDNSRKCDGIMDCWDISDEENCHNHCLSTEVPCTTKNQCILKTQICDGFADCLDSSDEPEGCKE